MVSSGVTVGPRKQSPPNEIHLCHLSSQHQNNHHFVLPVEGQPFWHCSRRLSVLLYHEEVTNLDFYGSLIFEGISMCLGRRCEGRYFRHLLSKSPRQPEI